MNSSSAHLKQMIIVGGALFIATSAPIDSSLLFDSSLSLISSAVAAGSGHAGSGGAKGGHQGAGSNSGSMGDRGASHAGSGMSAGGNGSAGSGQTGSSGTKAEHGAGQGGHGASGGGNTSLDGSAVKEPDEDSDRPVWAGVKGGKAGAGGKPPGAGSKKGDLYGDLYVLIRDPVTGVADTEVINGVIYPKVQAYTIDPVTGALVLVPDVSIPRDPETGDLITTTYVSSEVEFGRLSVGRAPSKVTDHSLVEALSKLSTAPIDMISLDAAGRLVITTIVDGVEVAKAIDSPLENLALYEAIANLTDTDRTISVTETAKDGAGTVTYTWVVPDSMDINLLKASLLAAAGDKAGTISLDTVMYINPIIGVTDDLSTFDYNRADVYGDVVVTVLVKQEDGTTYIATPVNVFEAVFGSLADTTSVGAADFATATNDALQVLEFVHDNEVR